MAIPDYATVRIVRLRSDVSHAPIDSSFDSPALPQRGDEGAVVHRSRPGFYLVESVQMDGTTDWLAEFAEDELEVIREPGTE